ncbi:MAG: ABC transporter substrate-binding protein [Alphaproteobacteria bacterium]|nr:ABC transporter substrate-binding protein [Alphaproteobacteria bacterium]MBV8413487.1 ABC transporter substrate-binding protein [Alphaproteobacteria bacterium]
MTVMNKVGTALSAALLMVVPTAMPLAMLAIGLFVASSTAPAMAQSVAVSESARAALPAKVRDSGELKIATALQWAPFAYRSEKDEPIGIDIGLMKALAAKLGLKPVFDDLKFPAIVPGVSTGRYQVGVDQISMSPERLAAVDMVPYFDTGSSVLVPTGKAIKDLGNLCGLTFVVTQGSFQVRQLQQLSEACVARGAQPIAQQLYPSSAESLLAIANGRGDAFLTATPQGVYIARINPKVELMKGEVPNLERSPAGIAVEKGNVAMRKAIALALLSAMEDGSYKTILDEYGVTSGAVPIDSVRKAAQ